MKTAAADAGRNEDVTDYQPSLEMSDEDLCEELELNSCQIDGVRCDVCFGARWLVIKGPAEGEAARYAMVVEVACDVIEPCGACGLAIH